MPSQESDFLGEIIAHVDDDAPRLIYADWLEECGDPRAEFIRLQCELAREPPEPRRSELAARQRLLLAEYGADWSASLGGSVRWYDYHRGFVHSVLVSAAAFLGEGGSLLSCAPIVRLGIALSELGSIEALAGIPQLERIRGLRLGRSALGDAGLRHLARSMFAPSPTALWLTACDISGQGVRDLMNSKLAARLSSLVLRHNLIGDAGAIALAESPAAATLEMLDLHDCQIGNVGLRALADSPHLTQLHSLSVQQRTPDGQRVPVATWRRLENRFGQVR
jgi:uncharacterized protein (TIGR02996 family)